MEDKMCAVMDVISNPLSVKNKHSVIIAIFNKMFVGMVPWGECKHIALIPIPSGIFEHENKEQTQVYLILRNLMDINKYKSICKYNIRISASDDDTIKRFLDVVFCNKWLQYKDTVYRFQPVHRIEYTLKWDSTEYRLLE